MICISEFIGQQQKMVEPFYLILYKNDKRKSNPTRFDGRE